MNCSKLGFRHGIVGNYVFYSFALSAAPVSAMADNQIAPLNYFLHSYGPASLPTMHLAWVLVAILVVILIVIAFLLIWAVLHKRSAENLSLVNLKIKECIGFILEPAYPPVFYLR